MTSKKEVLINKENPRCGDVVLVYSHVALWPVHHAESVEIVLEELSLGNKVIYLYCDGELESCPANPYKNINSCRFCKKQNLHTIKQIFKNKVAVVELRLKKDNYGISPPLSLNDLVEKSYECLPVGELVASQICDDLKDCFFPISDHINRTNILLNNACALYEEAKKIIVENQISRVYAWNGRRCSDGPVLYAAKSLDVDRFSYISGNKPGFYAIIPGVKVHDVVTNKSRIRRLYNQLEEKRQEIELDGWLYYNNMRYGATENIPGYEHFGKNFESTVDFAKKSKSSKKNLVIFTSSFHEYFGMSDYRGGVYDNHYNGVERIVNDLYITSNYNIFIRWHPNLTSCGAFERAEIERVIEVTNSCGANNFYPESTVNSYDLIEYADVVLSFGSTIGIESTLYGKPSILLGRALWEDLDVCYRPQNHNELVAILKKDLNAKCKSSALVYGAYVLRYGEYKYKNLDYASNGSFKFGRIALDILRHSYLERLKRYLYRKFLDDKC